MSPVENERGERLISVLTIEEPAIHGFSPVTFAIVIAREASELLLVLNTRRKVWELPGGLIDPGESPRECAMRELREESGQSVASLGWRALLEIEVPANSRHPQRHLEYGALFCGELVARASFTGNDEVAEIAFWRPGVLPPAVSAIDAHLLSLFR